jgi:hypothetical protein
LLYEDYVWVSLGNAMKAKQSKALESLSVTLHWVCGGPGNQGKDPTTSMSHELS